MKALTVLARFLMSGGLIAASWQETHALWTTIIIGLILIALEIQSLMMGFISRQVSHASKQLQAIEEHIKK